MKTLLFVSAAALLAIVALLPPSFDAKEFTKCELASRLKAEIPQMGHESSKKIQEILAKVICQVETTTGFNTSAISPAGPPKIPFDKIKKNKGKGHHENSAESDSDEDHKPSVMPSGDFGDLLGIFQLPSQLVCNNTKSLCKLDCSMICQVETTTGFNTSAISPAGPPKIPFDKIKKNKGKGHHENSAESDSDEDHKPSVMPSGDFGDLLGIFQLPSQLVCNNTNSLCKLDCSKLRGTCEIRQYDYRNMTACSPCTYLNRVWHHNKEILYEERVYPAGKWAYVIKGEDLYEQSISMAFMKLMRYICNENSAGRYLGMTVPILNEIQMAKDEKSFVRDVLTAYYLPAEFQDKPPEPTDPDIQIVQRETVRVITRVFYGTTTEETIMRQISLLWELLGSTDDFLRETYMVAVYENPGVPRRRNEIWFIRREP
ncbi:UNVERIFIED_CONTAM: hypothetical protein FKN15_039687 [Acipenser sinensis]